MNGEELAGLDVSRETLVALHDFKELVLQWTAKINLISASSKSDLWTRHIADSAQLFAFAPDGPAHWADLGSGGGFPAIVVAILAKATHPDLRFSLVESDQRKATFLRTAIRTFALNATVHAERIEALTPLHADILSARALAPLPQLLALSAPHLAPGASLIFPKGRNALQEIEAARHDWRFDLADVPSKTDPDAHLLHIQGLRRA